MAGSEILTVTLSVLNNILIPLQGPCSRAHILTLTLALTLTLTLTKDLVAELTSWGVYVEKEKI